MPRFPIKAFLSYVVQEPNAISFN